MNWLTAAVIAVLALSFLLGIRKGFLRQGLSLFGALICLWLITFIQPYVKDAILDHTSLKDRVSDKVDKMVAEREKYGIDVSGIEEFEKKHGVKLPAFDGSALSKSQQSELIRETQLPKFLKELLIENNNNEIYKRLGVDNWIDYIKAYLTDLIAGILAYVGSFVIVFLLYRVILAMAHIVDHLPLANGLNRALGGMFGLLQGVILLGLFFALLIPLCYTQLGKECFKCIENSAFLEYIYQHNPIMAIISMITG